MSEDLNREIRALLGQIGLKEGAQEHEVLEKYKDREPPMTADEEPTSDEMFNEDAPKKKNGKEARNAQKAKIAAATTAAAAAANKAPVISLSRPPKAKPEQAPRGKATKAAAEEEEDEAPASTKPDFPLNKPSLPSAPAPSTMPKDSKMEGLKWHQQSSRITLPFPAAAAKATAQSTGKKVELAGAADVRAAAFTVPHTVEDAFTLAQDRFGAIVSHFDELNAGRSSDARWLSTVMVSGTLTDKIAGMTLMIQEAPLYRVGILDKLLAMAHKQGRRENTMAIDALKDLFLNDLLPPRKLVAFAAQPFFKSPKTTPPPTETEIVYWALEDAIKSRYLDFLGVLEEGTHDEMAYVKKARIACVYELLLACPERERVLLSLLVNKLGDADKKVASKVVFYLTELVTKHPGFKLPLIAELEQLLYRSNIGKRAQYYAIIFLNQLVFTAGDTELANKLIHVYFLLFKQFIALNKKEHAEEAARLAKKQARRKQRQAKKDGTAPVEVTPAPKAYGGSNSVSTKFDVKKATISTDASDALRSKLLGGLLTGINRALPYASVSALEGAPEGASVKDADKSGEALVVAQMDMIFNLVHTTAFNTSVQALMLLYQALSRSIAAGAGGPNIDRFYRALYEKLLAPELLQSGARHGLFLNLLFKAIKGDASAERRAAFAKRILQVAAQAQPNFVCGMLYLLSEVGKAHKSLHTLLSQPAAKGRVVTGANGTATLEEDDDEEHFVDAPEDGEDTSPVQAKEEDKKDDDSFVRIKDIYDPTKRDPQFARAEASCLWEVLLLLNHFHPSVQKFARDLANGTPILYAGDPLRDFTNMNFLDRFVYKNPKQKAANAGAKHTAFAPPPSAIPYTQVNTPGFLHQATTGAIGDELQFFHRYFAAKAQADEKKESTRERAPGEDATEEEEDAFADQVIEREMRRMDPDSWMDDPDMDDEPDMDEDDEEAGEDGEIDEDELADGEDDEELDEDAEEAAALAEMEGGGAGGDDDSEQEMDVDEDDEDEDEFNFDDDEDDEDEDDFDDQPKGKDRNASVFASAEEFADLLNAANDPTVSVKQSAWEKQRSIESARDQPKGGKRYGAGKGMKSSDVGYKPAPAPSRAGSRSVSKKQGGSGPSVAEKPSFKAMKRKHMESKGASSKKKGGKAGGGNKRRKH